MLRPWNHSWFSSSSLLPHQSPRRNPVHPVLSTPPLTVPSHCHVSLDHHHLLSDYHRSCLTDLPASTLGPLCAGSVRVLLSEYITSGHFPVQSFVMAPSVLKNKAWSPHYGSECPARAVSIASDISSSAALPRDLSAPAAGECLLFSAKHVPASGPSHWPSSLPRLFLPHFCIALCHSSSDLCKHHLLGLSCYKVALPQFVTPKSLSSLFFPAVTVNWHFVGYLFFL